MKQFFLFIGGLFALLSVAMPSVVVAQGDSIDDGIEEFDDFSFEEVEIDDYRQLDYVGFGLGGQASVLRLMNVDVLNELANRFELSTDGSEINPLILKKGAGMFIGGIGPRNLRFGLYFFMEGSTILEKNLQLNNQEYLRKLRYFTNTFYGQIDYAIYLGAEGLMLFPGLIIGRETSTLELSQNLASNLQYDTLYAIERFDSSQTNNGSYNTYSAIKRNAFHVRPVLTLDYAINQYVVGRIAASYGFNGFFQPSWSHYDGSPVENVPDGLNADGPELTVGLFIGLFQK